MDALFIYFLPQTKPDSGILWEVMDVHAPQRPFQRDEQHLQCEFERRVFLELMLSGHLYAVWVQEKFS
jgi:hypothetical protein